jgi:hypothetical protein
MHAVRRMIGGALAGLAVAAALTSPMADPAEAATKIVKIQNKSTGSKVLSKLDFDGIVMSFSLTDRARWDKTDVTNGYATYRNLFSHKCLSFRKYPNTGFESVADRTCIPGDSNQEWKLGVSGDLQLRANGRVLEALPAEEFTNNAVRLSHNIFTNQLNQQWKLIAG